MPLTEDSSLLPEDQASAYIKSKIMLEKELAKYEGSLDIVVARPFNHTGPGQRPGFIVPDWAERFVQNEPLDTSRLDSWRDFTDVRDVVRAYRLLIEEESLNYQTYNIASGTAQLGYDVIDLLAKEFGVALPGERVEGQSVIYGSAERIANDTGWAAQIPIEQTIRDFAQWRKSQP
jgi:GDP-4-dehydro-6-deoxy-D-mannose reductase